jgi:phosphoribosylaminoimidazole-succinocarboxamide synthase
MLSKDSKRKNMIESPNLNLQYEGSVKNVFAQKNNPNTLWFSFTDKYSVFDWGEMPDLITNKGNALAFIGAYIFQKLSDPCFWQKLPQSSHLQKFDPSYLQKHFKHKVFSGANGLITKGLPSHFLGLYEGLGPSNNWQQLKQIHTKELDTKNTTYLKDADLKNQFLMNVKAAQVNWPKLTTILDHNLYFYPLLNSAIPLRLIPLEVVFSFGLLEGSSLKRKLDDEPAYSHYLGFKMSPPVDQWFAKPTLQFFSKLEPKDRLLSWQEATFMSNLSAPEFEQMAELALDTALALHVLFAERNLELWDGKLEFIFDAEKKQLLLADCVGPDEIRLLHKGIHLSKEILRRHYRSSDWYKSLATARDLAAKQGREDWQKTCREELKQCPKSLNPELKNLVDQLYGVLTNEIIGENIFSSQPNLQEFTTKLEQMLHSQRESANA